MQFLRQTVLSVLTLATLAACGQAGPVGVRTAQGVTPANGPSIKSNGIDRKLDYGWNRYKQVYAPKAKPVKMPRQGLLPSKIDLRDKAAPVYDQGDLGACTAFAMGKGMRELMQRTDNETVAPLSALFLYYEERQLMGTRWKDSGATITDGMKVLTEKGIATEETWPYATNFPKFRLKPSSSAYKSATTYKIAGAQQIGSLDDVRAALAKGRTVPFGFLVFKSFDRVGSDGVMPMPSAKDEPMGGHAVLAVGYDDQKRQLIVRNSWSAAWGDKGYFYMPYDFASNRAYTDDFWTAK